jgi:hypothetical protein
MSATRQERTASQRKEDGYQSITDSLNHASDACDIANELGYHATAVLIQEAISKLRLAEGVFA